MSRALARLVAETPGVLNPGERIVAAGRAKTVAGTESSGMLPLTTVWAVSDRRLIVFDHQSRSRKSLGSPHIVFDVAAVVTSAHTEPFDGRNALLVVAAGGHPAMVTMDPADATAIVAELNHILDTAALGDGLIKGPPVADPAVPTPDHEPFVAVPTADPIIRAATGPDEGDVAAAATSQVMIPPAAADGGDSKVASLRAAFAEGDWERGSREFLAASSPAEREWFVRRLAGEDLTDGLDRWVEADPESAAAYLARGANTVWNAWGRRGTLSAEAFHEELRNAEQDLFWAVELDFDDPVAFTPLIRSARGLGVSTEELCLRFDESVRRGGDLLGVHLETVVALGPLEGGSVTDMMAFAGTVGSSASAGSPLHVVVPFAHLIAIDSPDPEGRPRRSFSSEAAGDVTLAMSMSIDSEAWQDPPGVVEVLNVLAAAAERSGDHDRAAALFARAGSVRTTLPWVLLGDGADLYGRLTGGSS